MAFIIILILILFGCSFCSIYFLLKWDKLPVFLLANVSILILYTLIIYLRENNPISFGFYFKILSSLTLHSFLIFLFSIYIYLSNFNNEKSA